MCKKAAWIAIALIIVAGFALSFYYYPELPEQVPSHWNARGEIDGYMRKDIALFLMPVFSLFLAGLMFLLPRIDPLKKNYPYFMPCLEGFFVLILAFFLFIHALMVMAGLGIEISMNYMLVPAMSLLFVYIAVLLRKAKRNWFVGIRTPWTLSSDSVWEKTHRLGSYTFLLLAVAMSIAFFLPEELFMPVFIGSVLFFAFLPVVYSYFLWKQEQEKG